MTLFHIPKGGLVGTSGPASTALVPVPQNGSWMTGFSGLPADLWPDPAFQGDSPEIRNCLRVHIPEIIGDWGNSYAWWAYVLIFSRPWPRLRRQGPRAHN